MFVHNILSTVLVAICMVAACKANFYNDYLSDHYNDYAKKVSSYIRTFGDYVDPHPPHNNDESRPSKTRPLRNPDETFHEQHPADYQKLDSNSCYEELRKCWLTKKSNDISETLVSRRVINMLLTRARIEEEGSVLRRHIEIETSVSEQEALQKFGRGELNFREIDPILSRAIRTPESNGFFDYVTMLYRFYCRLTNHVLIYKGTVVATLVLVFLCYTLCNVRWDYTSILFASVKVYLIAIFLISWWTVLRNENIPELEDPPIECQPEKMNWKDKAMMWFYPYDCDKYREAQAKEPPSEKTPQEALASAIEKTIMRMVNLNCDILFGLTTFEPLRLILLISFIFFTLVLTIMGLIYCASLLIKIIKEPRKTCASIEKCILKFMRHLQNQLDPTTTNSNKLHKPRLENDSASDNEGRLSDNCTYDKLSCGMGRSVVFKIRTEAKCMEKEELEAKISSILGKDMKVDKLLGRMMTTYGEQITVAMKRKEDKEALLERRLLLRDSGIIVEQDIILLNEAAKWTLLGFTDEEKVKGESREICINGEEWIWNEEAREWVEKKWPKEQESIEDSTEEVKS